MEPVDFFTTTTTTTTTQTSTSHSQYYVKECSSTRVIVRKRTASSSSSSRSSTTSKSGSGSNNRRKRKRTRLFSYVSMNSSDEEGSDDDSDFTEETERVRQFSRYHRYSPRPSRTSSRGRVKVQKRLSKKPSSLVQAQPQAQPSPPKKGQCHICWEEQPILELTECSGFPSHWICFSCLPGVIQMQLDTKKSQITCCALELAPEVKEGKTGNEPKDTKLCGAVYSNRQLMLTEAQEKQLFYNNTEAAVSGSTCPEVLTFDEVVGTIACVCQTVYCLQCRKKAHEGVLCNESELLEEKKVLASVQAYYCPRPECGAGPFSRLTACHHMTCNVCKEGHWCALCGTDIGGEVYGHFCSHENPLDCLRPGCRHCRMFPS